MSFLIHLLIASAKRKSFTYGSNDDSDSRSSVLQRRHSERRHRYQRPSVSMDDTWPSSTVNAISTEEEEVKGVKN